MYAKETAVSPAKSQQEITTMLRRYGCVGFGVYEQASQGTVGFELMSGIAVRMTITLPRCSEFESFVRRGRMKTRTAEAARRAWEQAVCQRWRALALAIKAKLECVECGISTVEQEFMPWVVMPDVQTLGQHVTPRLAAMAKDGQLPKLLTATAG